VLLLGKSVDLVLKLLLDFESVGLSLVNELILIVARVGELLVLQLQSCPRLLQVLGQLLKLVPEDPGIILGSS
jgi:hypothetical protein